MLWPANAGEIFDDDFPDPRGLAWIRKSKIKSLLRRLAVAAGKPDQRIVIHRLDRREVAMGDEFGAGRGADIVRNRIQRQINDLPRIRRDIAGRAGNYTLEDNHPAAGLSER